MPENIGLCPHKLRFITGKTGLGNSGEKRKEYNQTTEKLNSSSDYLPRDERWLRFKLGKLTDLQEFLVVNNEDYLPRLRRMSSPIRIKI